ncbi:molybdopterin-binding protein [Sphingomonas spermidinifaciens]|uniref:Molybdopterin-binding protein n=1 Tax=Sphingomonas spermidinifaciens TaxID=1141889 RepID=A0A2A4B7S4_9SPHN|nr:molybdopterin-dependent oxidoreductase [Sphingomonas spermidinifaciens]PCD04130.1 molybdopterin-binding protein [Sphingomonas spermidinifaciens]
MSLITRRMLIGGLAAGAGGLLAGCDAAGQNEQIRGLIFKGADWNQWTQRALMDRNALAREFRVDQMSPVFRTNGTRNPGTPDYAAHAAAGFADWRVRVDGLVARPQSFSVADLLSMPQRAQITRHDCVEGWSAIGKWQGPRLATLLDAAELSTRARYLVFHCADRYAGGRPYYESIDLIDAFHLQTILALGLNDRRLDIGHGAPARLRVERQLGYKQAKYVERIEAVADLTPLYGGKGGLWEDIAGYEWYAGI